MTDGEEARRLKKLGPSRAEGDRFRSGGRPSV